MNTAKTFSSGRRSSLSDRSKVDLPGPGAYGCFSSFG